MSANTKLRARRIKNYYAKIIITKVVKKYPILYNTTLEDYGEKVATLVAWEAVANEMGESVFKCKKLWRSIVFHYNCFLKQKKPTVKFHFMEKHLKFLLPYLEPSGRPVLNDKDPDEEDSSSWEGGSADCEDETTISEDEDERLWGFESRKQFLMGYLPDIREMSYYQMSKFRQSVIRLVEATLKEKI